MPKGYWIGHVDIDDAETYRDYQEANAEPFMRYGGRFLVRAGESETMEGKTRPRHVIIEFPSYEAALECYRSDAYQHAKSIREPISKLDLVVVSGYEGPQPGGAS